MRIKIRMKMTMFMILSSINIKVIRKAFAIFFYERYFKCKKYKQNDLSNIQPNISISKVAPK